MWKQLLARWNYKPPVVWSDDYCRHLLAKGSVKLVSETCSPWAPWQRVAAIVIPVIGIIAGLVYGVYGK